MKSIVCCVVLLAVAAQAMFVPYPGMVPPPVTSNQYHSQDELGQARFGYAHPGQAASNYRDALGNQIGSYAFINAEGKEVVVSYTADHRGFRVLSNSLPVAPIANLKGPLPVQDTPEVAKAKAIHMAALAEAKGAKEVKPIAPAPPAPAPIVKTPAAPAPSAPAPIVKSPAAPAPSAPAPIVKTPVAPAPVPVKDTPEVAAAKRNHAAKWLAAKQAADRANLYDYTVPTLGFGNGAPTFYPFGNPMPFNLPTGAFY